MTRIKRNANVLVTAAGTVTAQGIIKSLKLASSAAESPVRYTITATDMSAEAAGLYRSDRGVLVPPASSAEFVDSIIRVCGEAKAEGVFVGADEELKPLAIAADRIERETGAIVVVGSKELISIGQDKWKTFKFLKKNSLPCAESALPEEMVGFVREFGLPVVVKPREGHGSIGFHVAKTKDEVEDAISAIQRRRWRPMLQEFLDDDDQEYTSGVTIDRSGRSVLSSISMRKKLKGGQTFKAFIDDYREVRTSAEQIALRLDARGPVNVQARISGDKPKVFEINPRFSASCPMRAVAGVNEADIIFRNWVLGEQIKVTKYERLVCFRYLNEVYVPHSAYERLTSSGRVEHAVSSIKDYF